MSEIPLLLVGSGGHAKVAVEAARAAAFRPVGTLSPAGTAELAGLPRLGDDTIAADLLAGGLAAVFVAIGDNRVRLDLGRGLLRIGFACPAIVHPSASVSPTARIGVGVLVMPRAVVAADAEIGDFAIVNTAAVVEHDCIVGEGAHVAPGAVLGGGVRVGARTLMGIGSVVRPNITIGDDATVGAGAAVVSDLASGVVATGVPAVGAAR